MRDAINMGIDYLRQKATKDKKVLVVITDGNDTASTQTFEALLAKARQSEILIYAIAILAARGTTRGEEGTTGREGTDRSVWRNCVLSEGSGRGRRSGNASRRGDSQSVRHRLHAKDSGARR